MWYGGGGAGGFGHWSSGEGIPLWPPDQLDIMHCYMMWNSPRMPSLKMGAMRSVWEVVLVSLFIYMLCLMKWYRCLW